MGKYVFRAFKLCCSVVQLHFCKQSCHMFKEKQQNTHAINPIKYLFNSVTKVCSPLFGSMPWNCCTEIFWEFFCGFKGKASFRWNKVSTEEIVPGCGWLFTVFWGLSRVKGTRTLKKKDCFHCFDSLSLLSSMILDTAGSCFRFSSKNCLYTTYPAQNDRQH